MNWMDIVVLIIIGGEVIASFRRGLVKTVIEAAGLLVALVTAKIYSGAFARYLLEKYEVFQKLEGNILKGLTENFSSQAELQSAAVTGNFGSGVQLPSILAKFSKDAIGSAGESINQAVYGGLAHKLSDLIIHGTAFMLIVFGVMIILGIVTIMLDTVMKLPLLKEANRLGGLAAGLLKGCFNVFVLMTVITFVLPFFQKAWLLNAINGSQIAIYFYNNNVLLYLIYYLLR